MTRIIYRIADTLLALMIPLMIAAGVWGAWNVTAGMGGL